MRSFAFPLAVFGALSFAYAACGWDAFDARLATGGSGGTGGAGGVGGEPVTDGGAGGEGAAVPGECGTASMLMETFDMEHNAQFWSPYVSSGGAIAGETGSLTFTLPAADDYANAEFNSNHFHDMRGSSIAVEVSSAVAASPAYALFYVGLSSDNHARFLVQGTELRAGYETGGDAHDLITVAYDPVVHRWWRIREETGSVYWEVSADNVNYSIIAERLVSGLFPMDMARVRLQAYNAIAPATAGSFVVDTIMGTGPGDGTWCPVATISDDFEDGFRSSDWLLTGGTDGGGAIETDGALFFHAPTTVGAIYRYISSKNYDLTDSQITVELVEHGGSGTSSFLQLTRAGQSITLQVGDVDEGNGFEARMQARTDVDGDVQEHALPDHAYDSTLHRFLRIRHVGGGLIFDTSEDGVSWPEAGNDPRKIGEVTPVPAGLIVDDLDVRVGVSMADMASSPRQTRFDNLNLLPSE